MLREFEQNSERVTNDGESESWSESWYKVIECNMLVCSELSFEQSTK